MDEDDTKGQLYSIEATKHWLHLAHRTTPLFSGLPITDVGGTLAMLTAMLINQLANGNEREKVLARQTSLVRKLMPLLDDIALRDGN